VLQRKLDLLQKRSVAEMQRGAGDTGRPAGDIITELRERVRALERSK